MALGSEKHKPFQRITREQMLRIGFTDQQLAVGLAKGLSLGEILISDLPRK